MTERTFWENAWKTVNRETLAAYAARFAQGQDPIVSLLRGRGAVQVCDTGCGCGAFSLLLARQGFRVSGFDLSEDAVALTKALLAEEGFSSENFRAAEIRNTGFPDAAFDAVLARDVLDHLPMEEARAALGELLRITRPGGCLLLRLDGTDEEYETESHETSEDGDYFYTAGKWKGMVFHPYSPGELDKLTRGLDAKRLDKENGFLVLIEKH